MLASPILGARSVLEAEGLGVGGDEIVDDATELVGDAEVIDAATLGVVVELLSSVTGYTVARTLIILLILDRKRSAYTSAYRGNHRDRKDDSKNDEMTATKTQDRFVFRLRLIIIGFINGDVGLLSACIVEVRFREFVSANVLQTIRHCWQQFVRYGGHDGRSFLHLTRSL